MTVARVVIMTSSRFAKFNGWIHIIFGLGLLHMPHLSLTPRLPQRQLKSAQFQLQPFIAITTSSRVYRLLGLLIMSRFVLLAVFLLAYDAAVDVSAQQPVSNQVHV